MSDFNPGEIECPRCGETAPLEALACSRCGLRFYEEEAPAEGEEVDEGAGEFSWAAAAGGALAAGALAFLVQRFTPAGSAEAARLAAAPLGALVGGWLAALLAREKGLLHGLASGVGAVIPAYLLEAYWRDLSAQPPGEDILASWALAAGCGALGGWLWEQSARRAAARGLYGPGGRPGEKQLYYELLARVRHDMDTAERLIDFERRRSPRLDRAGLVRAALDRLDRDRG